MRCATLDGPVRLRLTTSALVVLAGLLATAGAARADSQSSSNWSGYAVHGPAVHFRDVSGRWRVPAVSCRSGAATYSAMWVGLGGFSSTVNALEQTGTEADCDGYRPVYSAWYELVPAPSRVLSMRVHPGDLMSADVKVNGRRVTLTLADLTHRQRFSHTFKPTTLDTSSAEWILEAPGDCQGASCVTLPLADFHRAAFTLARAVSGSGLRGSIANRHWSTTKITLASGGRRFADSGPPRSATGGASPGGLTAAGSAFSVSYIGATVTPFHVSASVVAGSRLVH